MAMTNAEWMIQQGYKFSDLQALDADRGKHGYRICIATRDGTYKKIGETENIYSNRLTSVILWLDEEHVEPILDEAEKRYLSAVIKPFRDDVRAVRKVVSIYRLPDDGKEYITILMRSGEEVNFPYFRKGSMYKGMEANRHYELKELGL